jgi:hypothetical protein
MCLVIGIFMAQRNIDKALVLPTQQGHAWQMARLYDLAGISVHADQAFFPDYILKNPNFSLERLKKLYSFQNVDALMYDKHPTLISTHDPAELSALWKVWKQTVLAHPFRYLQHRMGVWLKLINKNITDYSYYLNNETQTLYLKQITVPFLKTYLSLFPSLFLRFYWVIPVYFLAIQASRRRTLNSNLKFAYRMMAAICICQLGIYFFLSMASDLRYIFLSNLLAFFLIPIIFASKTKTLPTG